MDKKIVTVFGGSVPRPGEPAYEEAYTLGALLARAGYYVQTGGYSGTMEAVSKGAVENQGYAIGITCHAIEDWRPLPPNQYLSEEIKFQTLRERLYALIDNCHVAVALPGGIGTLAEISAMWSSLQTEEIPHCPLILVGAGWQQTIQTMLTSLDRYVAAPHKDLLSYAPNVSEAFGLVDKFLRG